VLVAAKLLTAKLHSCYAKGSEYRESRVGVGNFGKVGVKIRAGVGNFGKAGAGHFTPDSATLLQTI